MLEAWEAGEDVVGELALVIGYWSFVLGHWSLPAASRRFFGADFFEFGDADRCRATND
jgi:hypothetical protein